MIPTQQYLLIVFLSIIIILANLNVFKCQENDASRKEFVKADSNQKEQINLIDCIILIMYLNNKTKYKLTKN
jgi:hypothetical protein